MGTAQKSSRMSALALAKTLNDVEPLIFVKDDTDAKRLLVAWTLYKPNFTDSDVAESVTPDRAYELIWLDQEPVDFDRLGQIAGLPYLTTRKLFQRLTLARQVFPDGTVSKNAGIVIHSEMQGYLQDLYAQQESRRPGRIQSPRTTV